MKPPSSFVILFLPLTISSLLTASSLITVTDPLFTSCPRSLRFTSPSPYSSNLNLLLTALISTTPKTEFLFFQHSAGTSDDDTAFGLAHCRPDASPAVCTDCLTRAAALAADIFPANKAASVRNQFCVLRYDDHRLSPELNFTLVYSNTPAKEPAKYGMQVEDMMKGLLLEAKNSELRIAAGVNMTDMNNSIHGLAWCTLDLEAESCYQCLAQAFHSYLKNDNEYKLGGGSISVSCILTYDNWPFINASLIQANSASLARDGIGTSSGSQAKKIIMAVSITTSISSAIIVLCILLICRRKLAIQKKSKLAVEDDGRTNEYLLLPFVRLKAATNDFSNENKLGEGRFGPVYKGVLWDGRQVVVKRLSKTYGQGPVELRNEAALVAQLQHKNLVKLLGCCLQEDEKLLVYEYLSNENLDKHLYDPAGRVQIDWKRRHMMIEGIARGLVYLHNHSRLRIIHRDLNASNILLDGDMNPKISDFGLAKLVAVDESQWNTERIAGTYGYMAPEYAMHGLFSTKSDVYSYGMVVLEIITGRRNSSFIELGNVLNLQTYVWQHWNQGNSEKVIDQVLGGVYQLEDVLRCIHIGLLCIQEDPVERPSMASVVLMLSANTEMLPAPSLPAYFTGEIPTSVSSESSSRTKYDFHSMDHSMSEVSLDSVQANQQ